jgi:hypothetical protein
MRSELAVFDDSDRTLSVGQAVEVIRGALAGATGVLVGFSSTQKCHIELDFTERGVLLVIDPTAVEPCSQADDVIPFVGVDTSGESNSLLMGRS